MPEQMAPPSSWLYLFSVPDMSAGAGLMALTVPWRGERITATMVHGHPAEMAVMPSLPMRSDPAGQAMGSEQPMQPMQSMQPMEPTASGAKPIRYKRGA